MLHRALPLRSWLTVVPALFALAIGTPARADIILFLSKTTYNVGERVEFALVNATEHMIAVPQQTWWRITDAQGQVVDGCATQPREVEISPGDYLSAMWDQIDCADQEPVAPGRYRLEAAYTSECCPGLATVDAFFELGTAAVAPSSWGKVKALFESEQALPRSR